MARKHENMVEVAVMAALPRPLTYRVPEDLQVRAGQRVFVPLGKRRAQGIVLEPVAQIAPGVELRDIFAVIEPEPLLSPELLTLGLWIAEYYVAPPGEVFRGMLPLLKETRRAERLEITGQGRARVDELRNKATEGAPNAELSLLEALAQRHVGLVAARRRFGPEVVQAALKAGYAEAHTVEEKQARRKVLAVRLAGPLPERLPRLSPVARRILDALAGKSEKAEASPVPEELPPSTKPEPIDHRSLLKSSRGSLAHLKRLEDAGLVAIEDRSQFGAAIESAATEEEAMDAVAQSAPFELTAEQSTALADLRTRLDARQFTTALLHGVTGSGKTEVYLRLIAHALDQNRTALMMVPEIALTPAVRSLFVRRFGPQVAVLHSGLPQGERHQAWWRAARGEARVVLGTRSAIFAPLVNLGLVIVDEEHEASYKQDETPRYQGRDVAVVRARLAQALCVLGSATPSLESYWNAERGKYGLVRLDQRVAGRPMASVEIVDMRAEFRQTFSKIPVSRRLKEEIDVQLARKAQTIILLNRRGYSWFLLCRSCGESPGCQNCSISLTYHRREHRLVCHYCGYSIPVPSHCPACKSEFIYYVGEGTEKIEDKFRELFPTARVERLDRDVARRAGSYERVLGAFRRGEVDILIGTQLVSKGHDFPGVTLVGVVSADHALRLPDFRAAERTFQLLTQVAGRAGRGLAPGRVLVQTFYPEHYAIKLAAEQNYAGFFSKEMRFRRMMRYPPVAALAHVVAQDKKLERAVEVAKQIDRYLKGALPDSSFDSETGGPAADGPGTGSSLDAGPSLNAGHSVPSRLTVDSSPPHPRPLSPKGASGEQGSTDQLNADQLNADQLIEGQLIEGQLIEGQLIEVSPRPLGGEGPGVRGRTPDIVNKDPGQHASRDAGSGAVSPVPADGVPVDGRRFAVSPASHASGFRFRVLGPSPAPLARLHGRHRIQFLIKASSRSELSRLLLGLADYCQAQRVPPRSVVIDMDPVSVM